MRLQLLSEHLATSRPDVYLSHRITRDRAEEAAQERRGLDFLSKMSLSQP